MSMKNIGIFKKIVLFYDYVKIVKKERNLLEAQMNLRLDDANRLYTVLNIPEKLFGEEYLTKKSEVETISESYVKDYIVETSKLLNSIGLMELYTTYKIERVSRLSFLIVIGFSMFRSNEYYNTLYYKVIPAILVITTFLYLFFK